MPRKLKFELSVATEIPMTRAEVESADHVLARLIAAAYAVEHPELFGARSHDMHIMGEPSHEVSDPAPCGPANEKIPTAGEKNVRVD